MGKLQFETLLLLSLTTDPSAHFVSLVMTPESSLRRLLCVWE